MATFTGVWAQVWRCLLVRKGPFKGNDYLHTTPDSNVNPVYAPGVLPFTSCTIPR